MELGRSARSHTSSFVFLYVFPAVLAGERRRTAAQGKSCFFFDSFKPSSPSNFFSHPFLFLLRPSSASHHKWSISGESHDGRRRWHSFPLTIELCKLFQPFVMLILRCCCLLKVRVLWEIGNLVFTRYYSAYLVVNWSLDRVFAVSLSGRVP